MTHNFKNENLNFERLGDRTLAAFVGLGEEEILSFSTYTYTNLNGEGNPNAS